MDLNVLLVETGKLSFKKITDIGFPYIHSRNVSAGPGVQSGQGRIEEGPQIAVKIVQGLLDTNRAVN
jgi:hypothetical protein